MRAIPAQRQPQREIRPLSKIFAPGNFTTTLPDGIVDDGIGRFETRLEESLCSAANEELPAPAPDIENDAVIHAAGMEDYLIPRKIRLRGAYCKPHQKSLDLARVALNGRHAGRDVLANSDAEATEHEFDLLNRGFDDCSDFDLPILLRES